MFTKNYEQFRHMMFFNIYNGNQTFTRETGATVKAGAQYNYSRDIGANLHQGRCRTVDESYPGVYFGAGSTPATKNDYTLESPITSGLTITNPSAAAISTEGAGKYIVQSAFIVRNDTDAEINIYEIGFYTTINYYKNSTTTETYPVLMERTVLTEPINILPGESKVVTYKLTFNQTLNVE